jgi:hypothetical protein
MSDDLNTIEYGLNLFNEKAEKLSKLSFANIMFNTNTGTSFSAKRKDDGQVEITSERRGPNEESIDAFVFTFRYFIQDNEKSSFRNLARYYENDKISSELRNKFNDIRKQINDFLDSSSSVVLQVNEEQLTKRKILDIFIYGGLSHSNDQNKKKTYDMWIKMQIFNDMVKNEFVYTLSSILKGINIMKEINKEALKQIKIEYGV